MAHYTDEEIRQIIIARRRAERRAENRDGILTFLALGGLTAVTYILIMFCACAGLN